MVNLHHLRTACHHQKLVKTNGKQPVAVRNHGVIKLHVHMPFAFSCRFHIRLVLGDNLIRILLYTFVDLLGSLLIHRAVLVLHADLRNLNVCLHIVIVVGAFVLPEGDYLRNGADHRNLCHRMGNGRPGIGHHRNHHHCRRNASCNSACVHNYL